MSPRLLPPDDLDRLSVPEPEENRRVCFASPAVRRRAADDLASRLVGYQSHAGFSGLVYYGDDLFLRYAANHGTLALSCHCDRCRDAFKTLTGLDAPTDAPRVRGIVPADHPWLVWIRHRCGQTYGGFVQAIEQRRREVAPNVVMGLCHGFPFAPFTHLRAGIYGPLTQPTAVVSSYAYPYLRSPRVDLIGHFELGRMGQRDKDVWMLGAINSNWTNYPAWQVFQNFWNMLAAGYRFIGLFAWHDFVTALDKGYAREVEACKHALKTVAHAKDWLLPVARHWTPVPAPFAALYSFTTEAFDLAPENRGHEHLERILAFHRLALARQTPMELICEEEVLGDRLDAYEAVCLHDVRVLRDDVRDALEAYVRRGGTVLIDNDILLDYDENHPVVAVAGATQVSPPTMIALLRDRCPPQATLDNEHVTLRRLHTGEIEYLVLVNNFTDQYWGFRFHYWDQRVHLNYADMRHVRDEPIETTLRLRTPGRWLADLATGEVLGSSDAPLLLRIEPSWGRALAVLPCAQVRLEIGGPSSVRAGDDLRASVRALSDLGQHLRGAFALHVRLCRPDGAVHPASGFLGLAPDQTHIDIPLGVNEPAGTWTLAVEGGFPRRVTQLRFVVVAPEAAHMTLPLRTIHAPAH